METRPPLDYGRPAAPRRRSRAARVVVGALLVLLVLPMAFGFLASFESAPHALLFRFGYAALGVTFLGLGAWLLVTRPGPL